MHMPGGVLYTLFTVEATHFQYKFLSRYMLPGALIHLEYPVPPFPALGISLAL